MVHKLNISEKGLTWKFELEDERLNGKSIGDKIQGKEIKHELAGYELQITGGSDLAGIPMYKGIEGISRKSVLLTKGFSLHKKPKGLKKKRPATPKGLRLRKTLAGSAIHGKTVQINLSVVKAGEKPLIEIFPEQNKPKEKKETVKQEQETQSPVKENEG